MEARDCYKSYLCPEEASQTRRTTFSEAPAEQANEHDEKQDDVSCERDDDIKLCAR